MPSSQERDYSAESKAARALLREAQARQRARDRAGEPCSSDVTDLAVLATEPGPETSVVKPDGAAAQPITMPGTGGMQCPKCDRVLCGTEELAFFTRINKMQGLEVHLMLKPEIKDIPPDIMLMPVCDRGAVASWQCACGHKLGDTRHVGPRRAPMTAFKSSSVKVCGQHHQSKKSQWPRIFADPPFNAIKVRQWAEFLG